MTVDELQMRDRRIAELEAKGRVRSRDEDHEYGALISRRDQHWRALPHRIAAARAKAERLENYGRQVGFIFEEGISA